MTDIKIKLNKANATVTPATETEPEVIDWTPALAMAAGEVQLLNNFVNGTTFPRPIRCNPTAEQIEGYLGNLNTPPTVDGFVQVRLSDYDYFDLAILKELPQEPSTFSFCYTESIGGFVK